MNTNRLIATAALLAHGVVSARNMDFIYEDGGTSGSGLGAVALSCLAGAAIGVVWASVKNANREEKIALDGAAIIGGMVGFLAGPILMILMR